MLEKSSKQILLTGGLMVIYHGTIVQSVKKSPETNPSQGFFWVQVGHDPWNPDWFICFGDPFILAIYHNNSQAFVGNLTHFPSFSMDPLWDMNKMVLGHVISPRDILTVHPSRKKHPRALFSNTSEKGTISKAKGRLPVPSFFRAKC